MEDTGPGIPEELSGKVFRDFFSTKGTEGTGIGLLVVQKVAVDHGGAVTFHTETGKGTTFRVEFPPPSAELSGEVAGVRDLDQHDAAPRVKSMSPKILVIDDEADVRTYLRVLLEKHGYEVVLAVDGNEAIEIARRGRPDLISLDLAMPNRTGTGFYRKLSRDKELSGTPVIVVSGLAGRDLAVRKPVAVFDKPIDTEAFLAAVESAIGK